MIRVPLALIATILLSNCSIVPHGGIDDWKSSNTWHGRDSIEIESFDRLVPASTLSESDFPSWVEREGAGTPGILWRAPSATQEFVSPIGTALPVTYFQDADGFQIYDVLDRDFGFIDGRRTKLAVNYTAPLAYMRKQGDLKLPVVRAMIKTDKYNDETGVYRFEPVDLNRIPVIFVHGLKSSPSIWKNMVNRIRADETVRKNYQFWSFSYPTGLPILYSGMRLREDLQRMQALYNPDGKNQKLNNMVIIGHSMGGLLTELQLKDSGNTFWPEDRQRPAEMRLTKPQKKVVADTLFFKPVPQIKRAIFIATPHRGSDIAISKVGEIISSLIRLPKDLTGVVISLAKLDPLFAEEIGVEGHLPNSVSDLRPGSEFLTNLRSLRFKPNTPLHSIVALGEGPLVGPITERNDGLVSYNSAHLDEAVSEITIETNHRAPNHSEAISEVVRILRLHLNK